MTAGRIDFFVALDYLTGLKVYNIAVRKIVLDKGLNSLGPDDVLHSRPGKEPKALLARCSRQDLSGIKALARRSVTCCASSYDVEDGRMPDMQPDALAATEVRRLCGDVPDWKIAAILATGATVGEIETAIAWAAGEDDIMGDARRPLSGTAGAVYDVLTADEEHGDEDRSL